MRQQHAIISNLTDVQFVNVEYFGNPKSFYFDKGIFRGENRESKLNQVVYTGKRLSCACAGCWLCYTMYTAL